MENSFPQIPFLFSPPAAPVERHDRVDLHLPTADAPRPAVVLVHGGPLPPGAPDPRDWLLFRGYAALLAEHGAVAALPSLPLHTPADFPPAAEQLRASTDLLRADPRVDPDRLALWFFSGSGLLLADWLRNPPPWLRALAATYPVLAPLPGWQVDPRFHPITALDEAGELPPTVLTRAGQDHPGILAGVDAYVAAAARRGTPVHLVDVPDGQHGFDGLQQNEQSRTAVRTALTSVLTLLTAP
jgi:acetyl esterase/lipase